MSLLLRRLAPTVALILSLAMPASAAPLHFPVLVDDGFPSLGAPEVTAVSWLLYDEGMDAELASSAPAERRAVASVTKIMTGLLVVERTEPREMVEISQRAADTGEREIGLVAGERLSIEALFKALMIHSANDAATAVAEHIGGTVEGFVELMNARAAELGLLDTHFANPHGLDAPNHYSTARDLLELARTAMQHPEFEEVVRARAVVFPNGPDGERRIGKTTNLLLGEYEGMSGVKTGFTGRAGLTLVATAERAGRRLFLVVLGSEGERAHFKDAVALFDYAFTDLSVYGTIANRTRYVSMKHRPEPRPLVATSSIEALVHVAGQGLLVSPSAPDEAPVEPEPPSATVIHRHADPAPQSWSAALGYWIDLLLER